MIDITEEVKETLPDLEFKFESYYKYVFIFICITPGYEYYWGEVGDGSANNIYKRSFNTKSVYFSNDLTTIYKYQ